MPDDRPPPLDVLHEDRDVVAANKPPGEPVIPAREEPPEACLQRRLERQLGRRLWVVHRIDRDASGLVAFASNAAAHRTLSMAFEHHRVQKTYLAFVAGSPPLRDRLAFPLHAARKGKTRPAHPGEAGAREAVTHYAVRRRWHRDEVTLSLLDVHPLTGRHHQIRVHLRAAGAPLLFDALYGCAFAPPELAGAPCRRLALHARRLDLPSPSGRGRLVLEAPLAPDLEQLSVWLDTTWRAEPVRP
jgi:RluA family pseudouridine synthase